MTNKPVNLIEGFHDISSRLPHTFRDIKEGVLYMARFADSDNCASLDPNFKKFWIPLTLPRQVNMTFGGDDPLLELTTVGHEVRTPHDLNIFEAISNLYFIALYGVEVSPRFSTRSRVAYSSFFNSFVGVSTWGTPPIFRRAWQPSSILGINVSVDTRCEKQFVKAEQRESITYACKVEVKEGFNKTHYPCIIKAVEGNTGAEMTEDKQMKKPWLEEFATGMRVMTTGLQDESKNCLQGKLLKYVRKTGRWQVKLDNEANSLLIRPSNLKQMYDEACLQQWASSTWLR
eukprot:gnl/TRDRNA2_/TRDRNA2_153938_c1_seq1.p1 gnl/TRDRNA2_/TRDRNA2_153938_c1~~gnl/TRDRNA2_/TRDRNA2_153938_c1_seq1.p1  ORF type:complete len:288 (+),score=37.29 gnl/TRDRNA2_/TRDRNA2_153938_c1_seq1:2-865(+)